MECVRHEVSKETAEAPSDRKGNEKGTTALPRGGRPTFFQSHSLPLTEITRDFPGKTSMEILLTSHLKRQNTSEHTLFPLVTHSQLLTFSEPIRICGLDSSSEKKLYHVFPAVQSFFVYWPDFYCNFNVNLQFGRESMFSLSDLFFVLLTWKNYC